MKESEKEERRERNKMFAYVFLMLIVIAIIALVFAISALIENAEVIKSDPLIYGMEVHGFISCICYDQEGHDWKSNGTGFLHERKGDNWINYSELVVNDSLSEVKN